MYSTYSRFQVAHPQWLGDGLFGKEHNSPDDPKKLCDCLGRPDPARNEASGETTKNTER